MNYTRPQLAIALDPIRNAFVDAKIEELSLDILRKLRLKIFLFAKSS
jgi:hypothetical protein